jgi:hypothetical protein
MSPGFRWTTFDLTSQLPGDWQREIAAAAMEADFRRFPRMPILSRESPDILDVWRGRVHAGDVLRNLPWLYRFYRSS